MLDHSLQIHIVLLDVQIKLEEISLVILFMDYQIELMKLQHLFLVSRLNKKGKMLKYKLQAIVMKRENLKLESLLVQNKGLKMFMSVMLFGIQKPNLLY